LFLIDRLCEVRYSSPRSATAATTRILFIAGAGYERAAYGYMITVTAAIMLKDGKVFIAQRKSSDYLPYKWEFPGGKLERGETPEECLRREMLEEFGIDVSVGEFFCESVYPYEHFTIRLLAYLTSWVSGEPAPAVHEQYQWVRIEALGDYEFLPADVPLVARLRRTARELMAKN
jgi:8-oxo-dGTP diphosphatase